jgi:hypothetical protein
VTPSVLQSPCSRNVARLNENKTKWHGTISHKQSCDGTMRAEAATNPGGLVCSLLDLMETKTEVRLGYGIGMDWA